MLGIFDSGFGGFQTLKYLKKEFPNFDFLFYADNKNVPYGNKSPKEIENFTFNGLKYLFDNGCTIVILACNTASAFSIKKWQKLYPKKKVLSITIPGVEKIIEKKYKKVGLLATKATIESNIYKNKYLELTNNLGKTQFYNLSTPKIVELIESEEKDNSKILKILEKYIGELPKNSDAIILGCTHYPIYMNYFKKIFKGDIIDPSYESVLKLKKYFLKHKDIYNNISKNSIVKIIETSEIKKINKKSK